VAPNPFTTYLRRLAAPPWLRRVRGACEDCSQPAGPLAALGAWPVAFRVRALLFDERHQCWILEVGSFGFCEHDGRLKDESAVLLFANEVPIVPTELA